MNRHIFQIAASLAAITIAAEALAPLDDLLDLGRLPSWQSQSAIPGQPHVELSGDDAGPLIDAAKTGAMGGDGNGMRVVGTFPPMTASARMENPVVGYGDLLIA